MRLASREARPAKTRRWEWLAKRGAIYGLAFLGALSTASSVPAKDIYIAQTGSGTGTSCSSVLPVSWFNNAANWGSASTQIGPGTTVHLCGTITSALSVQGSGTSSSPITILFEASAKISIAVGTIFDLLGNSWITIDGGVPCGPSTSCSSTDTGTGIIENTANGTGLANSTAVHAILGSGSGNIEIRNLIMRNFYVHTSLSDSTIDGSQDTCYYANGTGIGTLSFHDNTAHDVGWCFEFQNYNTVSPTINVDNNYIYNMDHGLAIAANSATDCATVNFHDNHIGMTSNWDTTANSYHHDGTHFFSNAPPWPSCWAFNIYNNLFDGNWGTNNTAHMFTEQSPPNMTVYNNVFIEFPGNLLNNGFINIGGPSTKIYNNTLVGSNVSLSLGANLQGNTVTFKNNVVSGVNTFVNVLGTFQANSLSNNIYAAVISGGNTPFKYNGTNEPDFASWQAATGQDASPSQLAAGANLSSSGVPLSASAVIGNGANLTSLGIAPLDSGTSAGHTQTPITRPSSGGWDVGAYESSGAASQIVPPILLPTVVL